MSPLGVWLVNDDASHILSSQKSVDKDVNKSTFATVLSESRREVGETGGKLVQAAQPAYVDA